MSDGKLQKLIRSNEALLRAAERMLNHVQEEHAQLRRDIADVRKHVDEVLERHRSQNGPLRKAWDGVHDAPLRLQ